MGILVGIPGVYSRDFGCIPGYSGSVWGIWGVF